MGGHIVGEAMAYMNIMARDDPGAVAWACYDWLQINDAGLPYLPIVEQGARDDARFWAETATPPELECYALAACDRLAGISSGTGLSGGHAMFASRQIKRLAGALFRRMSPKEQTAFAGWINGQIGDQGK